jgi:NTP pyrophosphatase (non-canonical NTP hydrolase)
MESGNRLREREPQDYFESNAMTEPALTIKAFQQHIHDRYYKSDSARGTPGTFLWFIEEVGELATSLHGDDAKNREEEFADVFAWLCTLANINGVDMEAAVRAKYLSGSGPVGHK